MTRAINHNNRTTRKRGTNNNIRNPSLPCSKVIYHLTHLHHEQRLFSSRLRKREKSINPHQLQTHRNIPSTNLPRIKNVTLPGLVSEIPQAKPPQVPKIPTGPPSASKHGLLHTPTAKNGKPLSDILVFTARRSWT